MTLLNKKMISVGGLAEMVDKPDGGADKLEEASASETGEVKTETV